MTLKEKVLNHWFKNYNIACAAYYLDDSYILNDFFNIGAKYCALCKKYNSLYNNKVSYDDRCLECPIYKKTSQKHCYNTPFDEIRDMMDILDYYSSLDKEDMQKLLRYIEQELYFLDSL